MIGKALIKALQNFFESPKGQALIGQIMLNAVSQSLTRTVQMEDGKTERGKKVIKEKDVNVLDHLAKYIPYVEGAVRGAQQDAGAARNRSQQTLNEIGDLKQIFAEQIERRNTIDSEILAKGILLAQSQTLAKLPMSELKRIVDNHAPDRKESAQ